MGSIIFRSIQRHNSMKKNTRKVSDGRVIFNNYWKGCARKQPRCNWGTIREFSWRGWGKLWTTSVRLVSVPSRLELITSQIWFGNITVWVSLFTRVHTGQDINMCVYVQTNWLCSTNNMFLDIIHHPVKKKTWQWIMSRNIIFVLMYHSHRLSDLTDYAVLYHKRYKGESVNR
jgi:hypothetical protein